MSLASHFRRKAIIGCQEDVDEFANEYHAWAEIWFVGHTRDGVEVEDKLVFNPITNLQNARLDDNTTGALLNIGRVNKVYKTRVTLCELRCEIMIHRPRFSIIKLDPPAKLCEDCAHRVRHHSDNTMPLASHSEEIREAFERTFPGCTVDERGMIVFKVVATL